MSTIEKALTVLDLFSESQPRLRAAEIARQLGWDKSNVQRYVADLAGRGLLEQDRRDKTYYLGPTVTRLAMLRERTHPMADEIKCLLITLVDQTGETSHFSQYIDGQLQTTGIEETKIRGTRVYVDPSEPLPFHASGSGLAFLSKTRPALLEKIIAGDLKRYTSQTLVDKTDVLERVMITRNLGYIKSTGGFESDVVGVAAPVVDFDGYAVGAVAVATPIARFSSEVEPLVVTSVVDAAAKMSLLFGYTDVEVTASDPHASGRKREGDDIRESSP